MLEYAALSARSATSALNRISKTFARIAVVSWSKDPLDLQRI